MQNVNGVVSDIQRYCIHDGPGIRTVAFLKGCPLRCGWCSNPESQDFNPQLLYKSSKCLGCLRCKAICPTGCIRGVAGNSISIDRERCIRCFECVKVCPSKSLVQKGSIYSVDEIIAEVVKDEQFYKSSNGGVTLSGGEVLGQYIFAAHINKVLKELNINTAIETTGYGKWEHLKLISDYSDTILFDIKHYESEAHFRGTGVKNDLIIENLRKLIECRKDVIVRIPVIPGFNMNESDIEGIRSLLKMLEVKKVDILPFHQLGSSKYALLDMEYSLRDLYSPKEEELDAIRRNFESNGFEVVGNAQ